MFVGIFFIGVIEASLDLGEGLLLMVLASGDLDLERTLDKLGSLLLATAATAL